MKLFILQSTLLLVLALIFPVRCWTYIGCFKHYEISQRIGSYDPDGTALSTCFYECARRNQKYFIVKKTHISADWDPPAYTVLCYCVYNLPISSLATCNYQCPGGSCGSQDAMSVYSVCDRGTWGWDSMLADRQCNMQCHCAGGAICRLYDGLCPGTCADTYWGGSCDKSCNCDSIVAPICSRWYGQCNCIPGRYGARCDLQCHCAHGAACQQSYGYCPNDGLCEEGYWRYSCNQSCGCDSTGAPTCQKWTGQCNCIPGRYGAKCDLKCHCIGGTACMQSDGRCSGECKQGYWGQSCSTPCDCGSGVACQKQDGQCLYEGCPPDIYGPQCDIQVPYHRVGCFSMDNIQSAIVTTKRIDAQEKGRALHQCRFDCIGNKNGYFAIHPTSQFTCYCLSDVSVEESEECPDNQRAAALTIGVILVEVYTTCPLGTYDSRGDGSCNMYCGCTQTDNWSGICTSDGTAVDCGTCSSGWTGELCAEDVDECMEGDHTCGPVGQCQNLPGSYQCQCPAGYHPATDSKSCVDVNECKEGVHDCQQICTNTEGSYACSCKDGYVSGDNGQCTDIDECESVVCPDSVCTNTEGSYICGCLDGFTLSTSNTECLDIDECLLGNHNCQQICTNTEGSFICSCEDGYNLADDKQLCIEDHTIGQVLAANKKQMLTTGTLTAIIVVVILVVLGAVVIPTVIIILRRRKLKDANDGNAGTRDDNNDHEMYATVDEDVAPRETVTNGTDNNRNSDLVIHENMSYSTNQNLQPIDEIVAYENITYGDSGDDVIFGNDNKPTENPSNELPVYDTYMEEAHEDRIKESNDKRGLPTKEINGDIYTLPDKPLVNGSKKS